METTRVVADSKKIHELAEKLYTFVLEEISTKNIRMIEAVCAIAEALTNLMWKAEFGEDFVHNLKMLKNLIGARYNAPVPEGR